MEAAMEKISAMKFDVRAWSEGAKTLVTENARLVVVETNFVVRLKMEQVEETMVSIRSSHAVRIPPRLPSASRVAKDDKFKGRKDLALAMEVEASFISSRQQMVGQATDSASCATGHLFSSPRPQMFQDTNEKVLRLTLIITIVDTKDRGKGARGWRTTPSHLINSEDKLTARGEGNAQHPGGEGRYSD
jgi:hypothetical protein